MRWPTTAEQGGGRGEDAEREQRGEDEQADTCGCDLGEGAEADHRTGQPDIGGEEEPCDRLGAALGQRISVTVSIAPLNISPAPTPATRSPARKIPKLGDGTHTASVSSPMPTSNAGIARGEKLMRRTRSGQRLRERGGAEQRE